MYTLYHHTTCPFSRKVRLVLAERGIEFSLVSEEPWKCRAEFIALNPACEVPVLEEPDGNILCGHRSICEYIDETTSRPLIGSYARDRAEVRRLTDWFDDKFFKEVFSYLVGEKIMKRLVHNAVPDSDTIRTGKANLLSHLGYIEWLLKRRNWLAGEDYTLADIALGSHLSVLDYIGEVPWEKKSSSDKLLFEETKNWYARIKSRPSFRGLLNDRISGIQPSVHYANLDF